MSSSNLQKIRIVCISDTHNTTPKLPAGDILIHAGDLTNQGSLSELKRQLEWIEKTDFQVKIVVAGNHDVTLDKDFYTQYGSYFHNQTPQDPDECKRLFEKASVHYLQHTSATITLQVPDRGNATFRIFGSPYSPSRGLWAFGYAPEHAHDLWNQIPLDTDVVVTHTPPKFHCDEHSQRGSDGCEALRTALWRVRPCLHVCGHIHEGRGVELVTWDLTASNVKFKEKETTYVRDQTTGSRKQFKVDLRKARRDTGKFLQTDDAQRTQAVIKTLPAKMTSPAPLPDHAKAIRPIPAQPETVSAISSSTQGFGGPEDSGKVDKEAIVGRRERTTTCIVNAAIIGSNWPHKAGKKLNNPVVADVLIPMVEGLSSQN